MRRFLEWMLLCSIGLAALSIVAAHAPPVLRRFLLFSAAFGAVAGWGIARLAGVARCPIPRGGPALAAALVLAGQLGMTWAHWRRESAALARELQQSAATAAFARQMLESSAPPGPNDDALRPGFDEMLQKVRAADEEARTRLKESLTFPAYRRLRVRTLGQWTSPWPELFWGTELLTACAVGTWMFRRSARNGSVPVSEATTNDNHESR